MRRLGIGALAGIMAAVPLALDAQTYEWRSWDDVAGRLVDLLPPRRAGQWEIQIWHIAGDVVPLRMEHPSMKVCIDSATDRSTMKLALIPFAFRYCPGKSDARRAGVEWVLEETCELSSGTRLERKTTISGDSQSTIVVRVEDKGGRGSVAPLQMLTARWVAAACTDGMKPGAHESTSGIVTVHKPTIEQLKEYQRVKP